MLDDNDEGSHDTSSSLNTKRKRCNAEKVLSLLSVARGDSSLDSHAISNSLIRVDTLVGFLAVEEVGKKKQV